MRVLPFIVFLILIATPVLGSAEGLDEGDATRAAKLVDAARRGDREGVVALLREGADVNGVAPGGVTAWQMARQRGYLKLAAFLETEGARTDQEPPTLDAMLDATLGRRCSDMTAGYAILVSRGGDIVLEKHYGMARLNPPQAVNADTVFRIGSVTKQFTAAAILKLQEQGKLSVQDPVSKYLPDFPRGDQITLHHLLTHTSGIASYTSQPEFMQTVMLPTSEEALIKSFRDLPPLFEPGERFDYCNSGYFLLGHMIGKIAETSYGEFLAQEFFRPLGMNATGVHRPDLELEQEAFGYSVVDGATTLSTNWHMSRAGGAGALYSTVHDLHRWNEALFGGKVVAPESLSAATAATVLNDGTTSPYGYGLIAGHDRGLPIVQHSGGLNGFQSYLVRYPKSELTIAVLLNALPSGDLPSPVDVAHRIAESMLWQQMEPRKEREVDATVDPQTFQDFVGIYDYGASLRMDVTLTDGQLYAQLTGQQRYPIYPQGADRFFWKVADAEVMFVRDDQGKVIKAVHTQNGVTRDNPRVEAEASVQVPAEQLDAFVGTYDYGSAILTVRRDGDTLVAQMTGQESYPIHPIGDDRFAWRIVNAEIRFVRDDDGNVVKGVHTQGGATFDVAKLPDLKPIELSEAELDEYVGRYNYGFLAGKMAVTREGKRLMAQLRGQPKLEIVPVGEDRFRWKDVNASITFERDDQGRVTRGQHTQNGRTFAVPKVE